MLLVSLVLLCVTYVGALSDVFRRVPTINSSEVLQSLDVTQVIQPNINLCARNAHSHFDFYSLPFAVLCHLGELCVYARGTASFQTDVIDASAWQCFVSVTKNAKAFAMVPGIAAIGGLHYRRYDDGLFYFIGPEKLNYADAKKYCQQVPGFQIPTIITMKQYQVAKVLQDMDATSTGQFYWLLLDREGSSGLYYWPRLGLDFSLTVQNTDILSAHENELNSMFIFALYDVHDHPLTRLTKVVCQENLDGVSWTEEFSH